MENLKWCTVPKFENYEINELLQVRHKVVKKIKNCYYKDGYLRMNINFSNGKKCHRYLHQIVAWTFIPNPENKRELHHIDGDKLNNNPSNLMWVNRDEHRKISKDNEQTSHKLTKENVLYIREVYNHKNKVVLAKKFNVAIMTIYLIATGYLRKELGGTIHPPLGNYKKIVNIDTGDTIESAAVLAKMLGMKPRDVHRRLNGERYNDTPYRYVGMENVLRERPIIDIPKNPIALFDINWNFIRKYEYRSELYDFLKTDGSRVNEFLRGKCSFIKGYKMKEIDEEGNFIEPTPFVSKKPPIKPKRVKNAVAASKPIIKYDLLNNEIQRFSSILWAARSMGVDKRNFKKQILKSPRNYYKGFIWKYAN